MTRQAMAKGIICSALGAIGWGLSGVCSQCLFADYGLDSGWLTAVRMLLSGLALLIFAASKGPRRLFEPFGSRSDLLWLLAYAFPGLLLCQFTYLAAIEHSNSATATVLQSLNVVMMALFMSARRRQRPGAAQLAALACALAGTFLVATHGRPGEMALTPAGLAFGLISAAGVLTYTLFSRPITAKYGSALITGWGMLIGGAAPGMAERVWLLPEGLDARAFALIAVIVLVGTAGGFSIFLLGVKYIGPERATLIGCLEPATAAILSALWLQTRFGAAELAGFALITLTVFLSAKSPETKPTETKNSSG